MDASSPVDSANQKVISNFLFVEPFFVAILLCVCVSVCVLVLCKQ